MSGHCGLGRLYLIVDRLQKEGKKALEQFGRGVEKLVVVDRVLVPQRQHRSLLLLELQRVRSLNLLKEESVQDLVVQVERVGAFLDDDNS